MAGVDKLLGGLLGGGKSGSNPLVSALLPMLGGLVMGGGLKKIMAGMQAKGLTSEADSWVGTGDNQPVTGAQMREAIPDEQLNEVASQLGVSQDEAADQLAQVLPEVVNTVSPDGELPDDQELDSAFDQAVRGSAPQ